MSESLCEFDAYYHACVHCTILLRTLKLKCQDVKHYVCCRMEVVPPPAPVVESRNHNHTAVESRNHNHTIVDSRNQNHNHTAAAENQEKMLSVSGKKKCSHCGEELGK